MLPHPTLHPARGTFHAHEGSVGSAGSIGAARLSGTNLSGFAACCSTWSAGDEEAWFALGGEA